MHAKCLKCCTIMKKKTITIDKLKEAYPDYTKEGVIKLLRICSATKKHPEITLYGWEHMIRNRVLWTWYSFDEHEEFEVTRERIEEVIGTTRTTGTDEEVHEIATELLSFLDPDNSGKVELSNFIAYYVRTIATGKKPWAFLDD
eukprot:TRINITY_DN2176_c0_g1_i2.p1 TRINITY_DN2176_c0_g1~~TRINITY_DN2176_c0_g1_i2.p1  ORF type:complete len:144 (-),score=19.61 TRINITY_DN2176_c0_g1_i2:119-550(-)